MPLFCFNPRARDGREGIGKRRRCTRIVSIHAPVMDAKHQQLADNLLHLVSIHAPVMDAKRLDQTLRKTA